MATDHKFKVKNGLHTQNIEFVDSNNTHSITASMLTSDTLSFSGNAGQLFSLTDSMSGTIFSVNDVSGIPSIEVDDDGTIYLAENSGNILIGTGTDDGSTKLQVDGSIKVTGFTTSGQLDVGTQNIKIGNNYIYASGDSNSIHVNAVTSFIPDSTTTANNPDLGLSGYRWKGIYGGFVSSSGDVQADTHFTSSDSNATLSSSGSGGNVYLRPNGKSSTSGQVHISSTGQVTSAGDITAGGFLQATGVLYTRNNLFVLNTAGTGWTTWATRANNTYNLSVGTISSGAISSSGAITGTSVGVTNIVTNKVVKFNGTVLDDSNITDTGSAITLGSNTTVSGTISSGAITATGSSYFGSTSSNNDQYIRGSSNVGLRIQSNAQGTGSGDGMRIGLNGVHAFVWQFEALPLAFATSGTERLSISAGGAFDFKGGNFSNVGTISSGAITSSDNVSFGNSGNISMDSSANGQVEIKGSGYQGAIALDGSAMYIYHNSDGRSLVLGTNETARLTISGTGGATFSSTLTVNSNFLLYSTGSNNAYLNADARDQGNGARMHRFNRDNANSVYLPYYENWFDGDSYHSIGVESNKWRINTGLQVAGSINFSGISQNAYVGLIPETDQNLMLGTGSGNEPRIYLKGTGNGQSDAGDIFIAAGSGGTLIFQTPPTSVGTITIQNSGPVLILDDNNATNSTNQTGYISYKLNGTENGYVGYGSSSTDLFYVAGVASVAIRAGGVNQIIASSTGVTIAGDLTVNGTTTTLNTATLDVEDKNITLNYGTGNTSASADGAGITIQDAVSSGTDASMTWNAANDLFTFSHAATFGYNTIDPDSFANTSGGFGHISDGGGWGARGLYIHGGATGDAAAIGHNGSSLYFGIQNGSTANSMGTWLTVTPAKVATFAAQLNVSGHGDSSQWNTAYGWGNHASAGYITGVTAGAGLTGGGSSGAVTVAMDWRASDTFTGTYNLVWNSSNLPYTASWLQVRGSDDTLLTRNIHPDGHIRIDNGSSTAPSLRFNVDQNTGIFRQYEGVVSFSSDSTNVLDVGKYLQQPYGYTFQFPASTQGWRKLAKIDSRGGGRLLISFTGGNFAPNTYVIDYFKNWSTTCNLKLEQYGTESYITGVRLRTDSSDSKVYLEIYLNNTSSNTENNIYVYDQRLLGYNSTTTVYTGALSAGSSSGTTHTEMDFLPQGSTFNTVNVEGATTLDSTLTVGGQSTLARPVLVNGADDNSAKADLSVEVGSGPQISLHGTQVQIGGSDMNWNSKFVYDGATRLAGWDNDINIFSQSSNTGSASGRDIYFSPQVSGTGVSTERMRIKGATGNVGIGVSNPQYLLHLNGGTTRTDVQVTLDAYGEGATDGTQFGIQSQGAYIWNYENTDLYFATNNTRRLTIDENGQVGIGIDSPSARLHVKTGGTGIIARIEGATGRYIYTGTDSSGHYLEQVGTSAAERKFRIQASNGSGVYSVLYFDGGNDKIYTSVATTVGIGTTTPNSGSKLDVAGSVRITSAANDQTNSADSTTLPATSGVDVLRLQGAYTNGQYTTEFAKIDRTGNLPLYIRESRGTANSFTNLMRIGGHARPDGGYTAEVFGDLKVAGDILSTGNEHYFVSTNNYIEVDQNAGTRFRFNLNGAKQAELIRVSGAHGQFAVDQYSTNATAAGYPVFTEVGDTDTGLFFPANNEVGLTTGGVERLRVDSSGNVGIGTTDPQSFPRLDVRSDSASNAHGIAAYGYSTNGTAILANGYAGTGSGNNYGIRGLSTGDRGSAAGSVNIGGHFSASGAVSNYALTTGSGNVGIGTNAPGIKLDVYDSGGSVNIIRARNATQAIALGVNNTSGGAFLFVNTNHALRFGTNGSERMRIDSAGNVGIGTGTNNPQKILDVITPNNDFVSFARSLSVSNWTGIHFGYRENNNVYRKSAIVFERTDLTSGNAQGKVHILNGPQSGNGNCTLSDAALTIRENGAVVLPKSVLEFENGSNTITASMLSSDTLSFSGDSGQLFSLTDSMSGTIFSVNDVSGIPSIEVEDDGTIYLAESTGNVLIGTGTDNGSDKVQISGSLVASGNITAYGSASDINVKENIEVIPNAVEKVQKLEGVTFNYKKDGSRSTGLIAQQLQEVLPEVVYETTDLEGTEHLAVRYGNVVGLLVEALKEQQTQLTAQQEQINQLTNLVNKLMEK